MYPTLGILLLFIPKILPEQCTTPNYEQAECVSVYACSVFIDALETNPNASLEFIRQSRCGNESSMTVCCGSTSNFTGSNNSATENHAINTISMLSDRRYCGYQHADDYFHEDNQEGSTIINEFPWLAALIYEYTDKELDVKCGGMLINARYVLTAAHCLKPHDGKLVGDRLGEYSIKSDKDCVNSSRFDEECSDAENFDVEEAIPHHGWNRRTSVNDIALIRLNRSVVFSDYIRPICLPIPGLVSARVGDTLVTSGWGRKQFGGDTADIKKRILSTLISNERCASVYNNTRKKVTDKMMCSLDLSNSSVFNCQGDSGAPTMFASRRAQWHVVGISSFSKSCGFDEPNVYTKVVRYLSWIQENIKL